MPDFALESALRTLHGAGHGGDNVLVIGLDEAGRGPWAGPVMAAAAWLDPERCPAELRRGLDDSKRLSPKRRAELLVMLEESAACGTAALGLGEAGVAEIDEANILQASLRAMARAAADLAARSGRTPEAALVDGNRLPALPCPAQAVVGGDGLSLSIAAASILAKVSRDRRMAALAKAHPGYGWERNQGYGTAEHRAALARLGVTPQHRRSFRPVREALNIR
jgi:ribonuclease HII